MAIYRFLQNEFGYCLTRSGESGGAAISVTAFGYREGVDSVAGQASSGSDALAAADAAAAIALQGDEMARERPSSAAPNAAEPAAANSRDDSEKACPEPEPRADARDTVCSLAAFRARRAPRPMLVGSDPA